MSNCPLYKLPSKVKIGQLARWLRLKQAWSKNQHCSIRQVENHRILCPSIVDKGILMLVVSQRWPMCLRSIAPNEPNLTNRAEDLWTNGGRESVGLVLMGKSATAGQVHTSWRREKPCGAWRWIRPGDSYYCNMTPEWHKMWSRLTAQICHFFWLIMRNQDFRQQVSYFNASRHKVSYFDVFNTGQAC